MSTLSVSVFTAELFTVLSFVSTIQMANILAVLVIRVYRPRKDEMLGEKVRSLWADAKNMTDSGTTVEGEASSAPEPNSTLFQCSECDVVYVAIEKDRCSSCRNEVTEVSQTISGA